MLPSARISLVLISLSCFSLLHAEAQPLIYPHDNSLYANIHIFSATYGENCGAKKGNATKFVSKKCNGKEDCNYVIKSRVIGDPAPGCVKDFQVKWTCGINQYIHHANLSAEEGEAGLNKKIFISCGIN